MPQIAGAEAGTRRERLRADTRSELLATTRLLLVRHGPEGLVLRAIAREMGLSAPALYRYVDSREQLVEQLVEFLYDELASTLEAIRDAVPPDRPADALVGVSRGFRSWATAHPAEFGLLFGSPPGPLVEDASAAGTESGDAGEPAGSSRFGGIFAGLVGRLYLQRPFPVPADDELAPALQDQLRRWCRELPVELPLGVLSVFLSGWIRLYGMVCMEVFGHLRFALADPASMFEAELVRLAAEFGVAADELPPV